ncbi:DUF368 domain-containing protein [bacterium]|jgi:putative membrane protein|nr:DUF368 domain-containing protein [bacterium]
MNKTLKLFLSGAAIGIANLIPGVSGGTFAVILGVYDDIIEAVSNYLTAPEKRKQYTIFLARLGLGSILAIGLFSHLINWLLESAYPMTMSLFIGLILGSIPTLLKAHSDMTPTRSKIIMGIFGFLALVAMTLVPERLPESAQVFSSTGWTYIFLFISGFIAAATMIIPGISGSLVLLIMGSYFVILEAIRSMNLTIIGIVGIGAIVGIISTAKGINWTLKRWPGHTYYLIIGLLLGSVIHLWPGLNLDITGLISVALGFIGFGIPLWLSR